ncbi:hypothetical protein [Rhodoplanes roseus]|uniref:hypothetical protein n=1 Tax=Rhodoplanes roseus TaxID=29409 RepID=UPI0026BB3828
MMDPQNSDSVWDAPEDTAAGAAVMRARSALMIALRTRIEARVKARPRRRGGWG